MTASEAHFKKKVDFNRPVVVWEQTTTYEGNTTGRARIILAANKKKEDYLIVELSSEEDALGNPRWTAEEDDEVIREALEEYILCVITPDSTETHPEVQSAQKNRSS